MIVRALNYFVPVEVNEVTAKSKKMASLSDHESYEPGSDMWIARQAYLKVMEEAIQTKNAQDLMLVQARYKALQKNIEETFKKKLKRKMALRSHYWRLWLIKQRQVVQSEATVANVFDFNAKT